MPDIQVLADEPANELIFAINCYVSTGDRIGEAVVLSKDNPCTIVVPVDPESEKDWNDFLSLRARVDELDGVWIEKQGEEQDFAFYLLHADDADDAAVKLASEPGEKGWGSPRSLVEKFVRNEQ
jgi:hypothetical protein